MQLASDTGRCRGLASAQWASAASASSSQRVTVTNTASVIVGGGFGHGRISVTRLSGCMASVFDRLDTIVIRSAFDPEVDR
jgi:hypothetical protein